MAISIDYGTKVIFIPRADMSLVQAVPTEIRELDTDSFRLELKSIEASILGMPFVDTHRSNPPASVGGVSLARVLEIINGFTITFEDGQYAVNLSGTNNNIGDVVNVNQVSVRSANSAGLTYSKEVEDQSFEGARVWVDSVEGLPGTQFSRGTPGNPSDNILDSQTIIQVRKLPKRLHISGDFTLNNTMDISKYDIEADSSSLASLDLGGANTTDLIISAVSISGDANGPFTADSVSSFSNLTNFAGTMLNGGLDGTVHLAFAARHEFVSCFSRVEVGASPVLDCANLDNLNIIFHNYSGTLTVTNLTGANSSIVLGLSSGDIIVDSSCTDGNIKAIGIGVLQDNSAGTVVNIDSLIKADQLDRLFFDHSISFDSIRGSSGLLEFPAGTPGSPMAIPSEIRTVADLRGLRSYDVLGILLLGQDHKDFEFKGTGSSTAKVDINGYDISGSKFDSINVTGSMLAATDIIEVRTTSAGNISGFRGTFIECGIYGTIGFSTIVTNHRFIRCQQGDLPPTIDCTNLGTGQIAFNLWDGAMTISNFTSGTIYIDSMGSDITLDASCTSGGTITTRGIVNIINNSTGTVINSNTSINPLDIEIVRKINGNKMTINESTGILTIYDDDDTTVYLTTNVYEDVLGSILYKGTGIQRRNKLT